MRVIKRNAIRCKKCGDIIESKSVHDFVECSCGACFVDGGTDYARIGGVLDDVEVLTEYQEVPGYFITRYDMFGNKYSFQTARDPNAEIEFYENNNYYLIIENEDHEEIYRTKGIERIIKAVENMYDVLIPEGEKVED